MKTHNFRFNPNLLAVELPEGNKEVSVGLHCIGIKPVPNGKEASDTNGYFHIYTEMFHGYKLLGKLTDLTDDDLHEILPMYADETISELDNFNYLVEKEIYWENPIPPFAMEGEDIALTLKKWHEAELRTFDKNRTIIFKKL